MPEYRLSKSAEADLTGIADYTIETFGLNQARTYRDRLFQAFATLAAYPRIGSDCGRYRRGAHRFAHDSHVIYYRSTRSGILILRILGAEQDPARHL
jgi:toxin ParE1/3/4